MDQEHEDYGESGRPPVLSPERLVVGLAIGLAAGTLAAMVAAVAFLVWFVNGFRNFN